MHVQFVCHLATSSCTSHTSAHAGFRITIFLVSWVYTTSLGPPLFVGSVAFHSSNLLAYNPTSLFESAPKLSSKSNLPLMNRKSWERKNYLGKGKFMEIKNPHNICKSAAQNENWKTIKIFRNHEVFLDFDEMIRHPFLAAPQNGNWKVSEWGLLK